MAKYYNVEHLDGVGPRGYIQAVSPYEAARKWLEHQAWRPKGRHDFVVQADGARKGVKITIHWSEQRRCR